MDRYESSSSRVQIIGGNHYAECPNTTKNITDRTIQPAIGLNSNYGINNAGTNKVPLVTNYGCDNNHISNPWPANNYQGIGSGAGQLSHDVNYNFPYWNQGTQTAFFKSRPLPWTFYPNVLDINSRQFLGDFPYYSDKPRIVDIFLQALSNVELEVGIRIEPDGMIQYSWRWTSLGNYEWLNYVTDSLWITLDRFSSDSNLGARYFDIPSGTYKEVNFVNEPPENGSKALTGLELTDAKKYIGYFFDAVRPNFGFGVHFGNVQSQGGAGISIHPGSWKIPINGLSIFASQLFPAMTYPGNLYRQNFFNFGYLSEIDAKYELIKDYAVYLSNT